MIFFPLFGPKIMKGGATDALGGSSYRRKLSRISWKTIVKQLRFLFLYPNNS